MVRIVVSAAAPTTKRTITATKHSKFPPHGGELTRHADQPGGFQQAHNHCDLLLSRAQRRWQAGEASSRRHTRWRSHDEDTTDAHRHWPSLVSAHCFPHRLCHASNSLLPSSSLSCQLSLPCFTTSHICAFCLPLSEDFFTFARCNPTLTCKGSTAVVGYLIIFVLPAATVHCTTHLPA